MAVVAGARASESASTGGNGASEPSHVHPNNKDNSDQLPSAIYDSPKDQALWLDRHNWLRSDGLVWEAADMTQLQWDFTLAEEAHAAIKSCTSQPIETPGLHVFIDSTVPVRALNASLIEDAMQSWGFNELFGVIPNLELPTQTAADSTVEIGKGLSNHYSQIVWSTTSHVGCAYTVCAHGRLAACKYSPAGNTPGAGWYTYGSSCSKCSATEAPTCSEKLCVDATSSKQSGFALEPSEMAATLYLKHKVRALQLTLDTVVKDQQTKAAQTTTTVVSALSDTDVGTSTLCNDTSVKITQEQMSLLTNVDGGLSPLAVVFGLFLGVSVILVMIVCIMHATKPKKDRQGSQEKDHDDDRVQVI
ncbi:Defense-related protein containing scp domain [Globisporangium polare]